MEQNSRLIELMERRFTAEEKRSEEEEAAKKAAATYTGPIGDPFRAASSSSTPSFVSRGFPGQARLLASDPCLGSHKDGEEPNGRGRGMASVY